MGVNYSKFVPEKGSTAEFNRKNGIQSHNPFAASLVSLGTGLFQKFINEDGIGLKGTVPEDKGIDVGNSTTALKQFKVALTAYEDAKGKNNKEDMKKYGKEILALSNKYDDVVTINDLMKKRKSEFDAYKTSV